MKTEWDYTALADAYLKRPGYSDAAIEAMLAIAGAARGDKVCDVGAGAAHLTLMLAACGLQVTAVEPNVAMRANGMKRTASLTNVRWIEATGERTGQPDTAFEMVTFGSSFNVCDRPAALEEAARILKPRGWFACMWNHRSLEDPIQERIESIIRGAVPGYNYGTRRENQNAILEASRLFGPVIHLDSSITHEQTIAECVEAWRSHATLARQAGEAFQRVVQSIENYLAGLRLDSIKVPYSTQIWLARRA
jgi:ubiquinone/menaquinone biosynthesis C-methylase UbiE